MTEAFTLTGETPADAIRAAQIIETVVGNAWSCGPAGDFTYVTPAALDFLGLTLEELNASSGGDAFGWKRVVHPEDYEVAAAEWRRCLETGDHYNVEHRLLRANGVYGWGRCSGQPMRDAHGRIAGWCGTVIDNNPGPQGNDVPVETAGDALGEMAAHDAQTHESLIHPHDRPAAAQAAARAFWSGVPQLLTYRRLQPDGSYRRAELRAEPGYAVSVDVDAMTFAPDQSWTTADDFGETDEAVRAAKVIESLYGAAFALDASGKFTYATPIAQTSIAMTLQDLNAPLSGKKFIDGGDLGWKQGVHPDDYEQAAGRLRQCMRTGEHYNFEYRVLRATGQYVWHRFAIRPTHDVQGRITGWYGTGFDIDVYKKTEAALRERGRELSQLVDMVPSHVWRLAADGEPTFFNKRMADFLGFDVAAAQRPGTTRLVALIQAVHPEDAEAFRGALSRSFATGQSFTLRYRLRRADGIYRWMSSRAEPLRDEAGAIVQWYGVCVDIEDLMNAQSALRDRERELSHLVDMVPSYLWRLTPEGVPNFFNKRLIDFFGLDVDTADKPDTGRLAAIIETVVHPDDAAAVREALNRSFITGDRFSMRYRLRRADGVYRWVDGSAEPMRGEDGRILQWYGLSHDIDDQLRVEEALRERERFLWQLVETLPAMIDCAAPDGEPIYRSQQLRQYLGYELEELDDRGQPRLAGTLEAGVHPDDLAIVQEKYAHSLSTGAPYARRHRLRRYDGEYRWVETRAAPMCDAEGAIVQWNVICLDIDGEVRAQEDLRLAQEKMARASQAASLAELSASIAHEVNQPLAAVVANSHACQRWLTTEPPNLERAQRTVERIIRDANSAADVVSRIRALFKRTAEAGTLTALEGVVAEACGLMAEEAARRRVRLETNIERGLPLIALDRVQVQQVLVNLMRNGMEAMEATSGDSVLAVRLCRTENAIRTEIGDCGSGIENPERIFEPFFTTKQNGMGMGLAICRSIIEAHGGRLWAEKNEPHGSKFIFTLPMEAKTPS